MAKIIFMRHRVRFLFCLVLLLVSLLLIGAGRITGGLVQREDCRKVERDVWREMLLGMTGEIPMEHRQQWRTTATDNPQFFIQANTSQFITLSRVD